MTTDSALFAGIDLGTSGVRGVCVDKDLQIHCSSAVAFDSHKDNRRNSKLWWQAVNSVIQHLVEQVGASRIVSISIDGTSGTMLAVDDNGRPMGDALLYNDPCSDQTILKAIAEHAPLSSAVHGASSGLARAITLSTTHTTSSIMHEADWIASQLTGVTGISDENNALKTGYDPLTQQWPDWIDKTGISRTRLPDVIPAGQLIAPVNTEGAKATGLSIDTLVIAGTTDGCASFLATGAENPGDGVTVLGSTLTIKLLSENALNAPEFGIYSHRIGSIWLAGGASNTGGNVLAQYFSPEEIEILSVGIDTSLSSGLDYYPLSNPGERFPINDSQLAPRLTPRPDNDQQFLYGMLEGIAKIESLAYQRLHELGAPALTNVRTVGGGSHNTTWMKIRQRLLNVELNESQSDQAALGTARLARDGFIGESVT